MSNIKTRSMKQEDRDQFWYTHIKAWEASDLTQAEYCRQNNIDKNHFSKRKRKAYEEQKNYSFIQIPKNTYIQKAGSIILIINDSIKIKITSDFDPSVLQAVLKALGVKNDN